MSVWAKRPCGRFAHGMHQSVSRSGPGDLGHGSLESPRVLDPRSAAVHLVATGTPPSLLGADAVVDGLDRPAFCNELALLEQLDHTRGDLGVLPLREPELAADLVHDALQRAARDLPGRFDLVPLEEA